MQQNLQQLYENNNSPSEFLPKNAVIISIDSGSIFNVSDEDGRKGKRFNCTCDTNIDDAIALLKTGAELVLKDGDDYIRFNVYRTNQWVTFHQSYGDEGRGYLIEVGYTAQYKYFYCYVYIRYGDYYEKYTITDIINDINNNEDKSVVLNHINDMFVSFSYFKNYINSPMKYKFIIGYNEANISTEDDKIIITINHINSIQYIVISEDGSYTNNTIQIVDQTLYRLSNLNIEPITNPRVWIGNSKQYAAIAEKDVNTTYIVKSE